MAVFGDIIRVVNINKIGVCNVPERNEGSEDEQKGNDDKMHLSWHIILPVSTGGQGCLADAPLKSFFAWNVLTSVSGFRGSSIVQAVFSVNLIMNRQPHISRDLLNGSSHTL